MPGKARSGAYACGQGAALPNPDETAQEYFTGLQSSEKELRDIPRGKDFPVYPGKLTDFDRNSDLRKN